MIPSLERVKHVVLVLSGKGGVGKSSVTTQLAITLANQGYKVGVLDIDLTGPSIPRMFGVENRKVHQSSQGWIPVYVGSGTKEGASDKDNSSNNSNNNLCIMSLGFLLPDRGSSVVWRGPKKTAMIRQFLKDVVWGELDYLLIDTPPGTSDEHISVAEELKDCKPDGAVLVTTPQDISTADVRKELDFCHKVGFRVLGVIENMSGYVCPHCSECTNIFSTGGGEKLAQQHDLKFLGRVPIDAAFITMVEDESQSLIDQYQTCELSKIFDGIGKEIVGSL